MLTVMLSFLSAILAQRFKLESRSLAPKGTSTPPSPGGMCVQNMCAEISKGVSKSILIHILLKITDL